MPDETLTALHNTLVALLKEPDKLKDAVNAALKEAWGSAGIGSATKTQVMGQWNVSVQANVALAEEEWLAAYPTIKAYHNNTELGTPTEMTQVAGTNIWVGTIVGVYPEPNFVKLEVQYMDSSYTTTTVTDVAEIT